MSMGTRQNTSTTCAGVATIGVPTLSEGVDHDWHPGQPRELTVLTSSECRAGGAGSVVSPLSERGAAPRGRLSHAEKGSFVSRLGVEVPAELVTTVQVGGAARDPAVVHGRRDGRAREAGLAGN